MNQMTQAFQAAGVKQKPLMERVWTHIKDHPDSKLSAVTTIYGPTAAQAVNTLYTRKMLTRKGVPQRAKDGRIREIFEYRAAMETYELLPLPLKTKTVAREIVTQKPPTELKPASSATTLDAYIDGLTVAEARALYQKLKNIFN